MSDPSGEQVKIGMQAGDFPAWLRAPVLWPGDAGFAEVVRLWIGMISKTPALIAQPGSANETREVVELARLKSLPLSVKGGGCHIAGTSLAGGGMTLDVSKMRTVKVDPERRIAHVEPGCLIRGVDLATQKHGLATVFGADSETGVAGLTLGGGFGYLTRCFGTSSDNLEEVEVVTADGEIRRAAADENEDLFWALRGGGGNFGVVTRFTFRLHEVGPEITGGLILWDAEDAEDVIGLYRQLAEAAPRELSLTLIMRLAPPAPFIPEIWHGKPVIAVLACHIGEASQAAKDLESLRAVGKPIADVITQKSYLEQPTRALYQARVGGTDYRFEPR